MCSEVFNVEPILHILNALQTYFSFDCWKSILVKSSMRIYRFAGEEHEMGTKGPEKCSKIINQTIWIILNFQIKYIWNC